MIDPFTSEVRDFFQAEKFSYEMALGAWFYLDYKKGCVSINNYEISKQDSLESIKKLIEQRKEILYSTPDIKKDSISIKLEKYEDLSVGTAGPTISEFVKEYEELIESRIEQADRSLDPDSPLTPLYPESKKELPKLGDLIKEGDVVGYWDSYDFNITKRNL